MLRLVDTRFMQARPSGQVGRDMVYAGQTKWSAGIDTPASTEQVVMHC